MLHLYPIKQLMHQLTGLNVESRAVHELTHYIEGKTHRVIIIRKDDLRRLIYRYVLPERQERFLKLAEKIDTNIQQTFNEVDANG